MSLLQQITELVAPWDRPGVPGGVVAVARDGVVQECVPFGYASLEHEVRNSRETVFYIASTSKQLVAACIAVLERDGRLSANDPVAKWVPEVERLGDIRVHHLVHHTSGIRDKYSLAAIAGLPIDAVGTDEGTLALLSRQRGLNFAPGSRFMYSNSGYFLLAQVVERCSGQSLVEFADQHLFAPLGMTGTRFRTDTSEVIPHRAVGHTMRPDGTWKLAEYRLSSLGPGGVVTTVDSLARWGAVFGSSAALDGLGERLVATRPLDDGTHNIYAYGLQTGSFEGRAIVQHGGGVHGFSAQMIQVPDEGLTVICLANCPQVNAQLVASQVLRLALGVDGGPVPAVPTADQTSLPTVGSYLDADEASLVTVESGPDGQHLLGIMGQRIPLRPLGGDVWGVGIGQITFDREGMTLRLGDTAGGRYTRLEPLGPLADVTSYEGSYTSDELLVTLTLTVADGEPALVWPDQAPRRLTPVGDDLFTLTVEGTAVPVRVLREGGRVTGLRISVDRAIGTVFSRA